MSDAVLNSNRAKMCAHISEAPRPRPPEARPVHGAVCPRECHAGVGARPGDGPYAHGL